MREKRAPLRPDAVIRSGDPITPNLVRKWYTEARPKRGQPWPEPEDRFIIPIAKACNAKRQKVAGQRKTAAEEVRSRRRIQDLRTAIDTILTNLRSYFQELDNWPADTRQPDLSEHRRHLANLYQAASRAKPMLEGGPKLGGQESLYGAFAHDIAADLKSVMELYGVRTSLNQDGPLIAFVSLAVHEVYGEEVSVDAEALSRTIRRYEKRGR